MRTGKELLVASNEFAVENRFRSWWSLWSTLALLAGALTVAFINIHWTLSLAGSLVASLLVVRIFIIFHDYEHGAILRGSWVAKLLMNSIGIILLCPPAIWKHSHDDHHKNNARKFGPTLGTFPVVSIEQYVAMNWRERFVYLLTRHPLVIALGYITVFFWEMSLKSFLQQPKRNIFGLVSASLHVGVIVALSILNPHALWFCWLIPFLVGSGIGAYLFYAQHNFPGMKLRHAPDWDYVQAALISSSFMKMNPVMHWFTGNIGFHHVHHLNAKIPFYRLPEAMAKIEELQSPACTTLAIPEIIRCLRLKLWDPERDRLVSFDEASAV
ncbi:MAG: fatty acid desaturase [Pirellulales bacterium]|nr:fatty acid desaturase [Pirellulales bacterium]